MTQRHFTKEELEEIVPCPAQPYTFHLFGYELTVKFFRYGAFHYTTCHIHAEKDGEHIHCWGNTVLHPKDKPSYAYAYRVAYNRAIESLLMEFDITDNFGGWFKNWRETSQKLRKLLFDKLVMEYDEAMADNAPDGVSHSTAQEYNAVPF